MQERSAAIVTIHRASTMTPQGRQAVVRWLRKQANYLKRHGTEYAPRFTARYLYTPGR